MPDAIQNVAALEACIGRAPGPINLKVIDHLDDGARHWIASSPMLFAAFGNGRDIAMTIGGGEAGFARAVDASRLTVSASALDDPNLAVEGCGAGMLFVSPSIGETLRVGGRVVSAGEGRIDIVVDECYLHCAKAMIRSNFWQAVSDVDAPGEALSFLAASRFLALATADREGHADLSPKGDPSGSLIRVHQGKAWYADRPGNRRADSFRNILVQPRVAAAALIPGSTGVVLLSGTARISADQAMRDGFAVAGKTPPLVTCIEQVTLTVRKSAAMARARLWPAAPRAQGIDPAAMFVAHIKLSKTRGLQAGLVRAALAVPGMMEKGLQHDYRNNLY
ncbi:hypothetical protein W02_00530 [Nitrospira sp. KM1]|uniref:pyridoxamine 5'-phosphate oxidase family protein n=1 Tax=Nitrospira sp. KM1 TaxID=1936990 RepID=UPI0013A783E7|nr:pyridoxamine 5'-phosphate oxidase family protein [Nitrospira sp. KM1]BCA52913.1 hypothetical protein W02_00530 [Nitrospira sp. KM1]